MEHDEAKRSSETAAKPEQVQRVSISDLHPFENHPFRVLDDESMAQTVESIKQMGIANPLIVRPGPDGGYEIISGHRRHHAAELAGLDTIPVIVRELDDDAAVIMMVDSNLQRESILPSEKAMAYKMKMDALRHQGRSTSRQDGAVDKVHAFRDMVQWRQEKRRLLASTHAPYHPFEVQSGRREEAVVFRCL